MNSGAFSTRQIVLFGASGLLGSAIARTLPATRVRSIRWAETVGKSDAELTRLLGEGGGRDFLFANGLTDPKLPAQELLESNALFPARVVELTNGLSSESENRYLSFGSIQENFPEVCRPNPYLSSKLALFEKMRGFYGQSGSGRFLHFRIHTLYGGAPKAHMFLGQMFAAIRERRVFEMSSGDQLREYHHADDVGRSIAAVLLRRWEFGPFIELSSGRPLRLADLAREVFAAFGASELLKLGALTRLPAENTRQTFEPSPEWLLGRSREPIAGVIEELRQG